MNVKLTEIMAKFAIQLMNNAQMGLAYGSWSDEFSYKQIIQSYESVKQQAKETIDDITKLSGDELKVLGFIKLSKEQDVYLIPIWAYDLIPDGTKLVSIDDEVMIKGQREIDMDVRVGCIAWGLIK